MRSSGCAWTSTTPCRRPLADSSRTSALKLPRLRQLGTPKAPHTAGPSNIPPVWRALTPATTRTCPRGTRRSVGTRAIAVRGLRSVVRVVKARALERDAHWRKHLRGDRAAFRTRFIACQVHRPDDLEGSGTLRTLEIVCWHSSDAPSDRDAACNTRRSI
jgi:hypothetical protein